MAGKPSAFERNNSKEAFAHKQRCKALPSLQPGEREHLVTAFLAVRSMTVCPARYAAPVEQCPRPA